MFVSLPKMNLALRGTFHQKEVAKEVHIRHLQLFCWHFKGLLWFLYDMPHDNIFTFLESGGVTNDADADLFSDTSSATGESIQSSRYSAETSQSSVYSKMSG